MRGTGLAALLSLAVTDGAHKGVIDQYGALSDLGDRDVSGILGNITVLVKSKVLMWDHALI
jgi:hypothetical protein